MKADDAKRMVSLKQENARLKRLVTERELDILILKEENGTSSLSTGSFGMNF